jgi:O-antigen ligase
MPARLVAVLLAWITFAGGGVYTWAWMPWACAAFALLWMVRPGIATASHSRILDVALMVTGVAIFVQVVPLPLAMLRVIDPHAVPIRAGIWLLPPTENLDSGTLPISIMPGNTAAALAVFASAVALYWTCRRICEEGGAGRLIRAIATIGLVASLAAIIQRAESKDMLFGVWQPLDAGARPFGPFVNRNHFASWMVMACPLVFGYLLARTPSDRPRHFAQRLADALRQIGSVRSWLVAALGVMALATLISASRSGILSLAGALAASSWLSLKTRRPGILRSTLIHGSMLTLVILAFANFDPLIARLDETLATTGAGRGRQAIWADTHRMIKDFAMTGTGAGTYGLAIPVYQTAASGYAIGHAHNHYLHLAAEGGALVAIPAALVVITFMMALGRQMSHDGHSSFLIRAGAAAGIAGVLLQSVWETGMRMPANATMLAILSAIATHTPAGPRVPPHLGD